tara:strand:+ start:85 stop:480 length:396 start_codon:yes stop_codon:yes gene_type:complete
VTGSGMAVIQCPHCGKNVELEDGSLGLFDCPYCKNEFEFEGEAKTITISLRPGKVVITLLSLSIIFGIGAGWIYIEDLFSPENVNSLEDAMNRGLSTSPVIMIADFCLAISGMLLLVSTVAYVIQQIRFRI